MRTIIKKNIQQTKNDIKKEIARDHLIVYFSRVLEDINENKYNYFNRIREFYFLYFPELSFDFDAFLLAKSGIFDRNNLAGKLGINKNSFGLDLNKEDLAIFKRFIDCLDENCNLKNRSIKNLIEKYLESLMKQIAPNISRIDLKLGIRLISTAGSLKRLAMSPGSKTQLLGAEKALFRHIKSGAKSPKHGLIMRHPLLANAPANQRGKIARQLANKLAIAARMDFFKK